MPTRYSNYLQNIYIVNDLVFTSFSKKSVALANYSYIYARDLQGPIYI